MVSRLIAAAVALLLAGVVVANAIVDSLAPVAPATAARFWAGHPDVESELGMVEIAVATREGRAVAHQTFALMADAAGKAPLAPEPFLVRGVAAQMAGRSRTAELAFRAAERRDPRSLPAHYFLAAHHFEARDPGRGFEQVGRLLNLAPNGIGSAAPYVAQYARDRANWPQLRALFRSNPKMENAAMVALAQNPANADLIFALTPPSRRTSQSPWLPVLLNSLVEAGKYARAKAAWGSAAGVGPAAQQLIFDTDFAQPAPPPPFNWALTTSAVGLAERQAGALHVIFYGQEDGTLARQLLVLEPGRYRVTHRLGGGAQHADALNWSIRCANAQRPLSTIPLPVASGRGWSFEIPRGCSGQWLELVGRSIDIPEQADVTIDGIAVAREAIGG